MKNSIIIILCLLFMPSVSFAMNYFKAERQRRDIVCIYPGIERVKNISEKDKDKTLDTIGKYCNNKKEKSKEIK